MQTIQSQNTLRLDDVKHLRDIFNAQNSQELKRAFDALHSCIEISEEDLEVQFNRYFIGPMEPIADPFASIYIDDPDVVMSKSTLHVRELYETMGFTYPLKNIIPDDHLGVELDAYYQLLYLEEAKEITYLSDLRHYFLHEHINLWVPRFIERAFKESEHDSKAITFILLQLKSLLIRETTTQGVTA